MTHICIGNLTIIASDNGLAPGRRQTIIWTNAGILLIELLGTYFSETVIRIQTFSFKKMHLKMSSAKWHSFCLGLNVLTNYQDRDGNNLCDMFPGKDKYTCQVKNTNMKLLCIYHLNINSLATGKFDWNVRPLSPVIFNLNSVVYSWGISCEIAFRWISLDLTDDNLGNGLVLSGNKPSSEPMLTHFYVPI